MAMEFVRKMQRCNNQSEYERKHFHTHLDYWWLQMRNNAAWPESDELLFKWSCTASLLQMLITK